MQYIGRVGVREGGNRGRECGESVVVVDPALTGGRIEIRMRASDGRRVDECDHAAAGVETATRSCRADPFGDVELLDRLAGERAVVVIGQHDFYVETGLCQCRRETGRGF